MGKRAVTLNKIQLLEKVKSGQISNVPKDDLHNLVQTSSFEPRIDGECFEVSSRVPNTILANPHKQIYEILSDLPSHDVKKHDITKGIELKRGSHYLFPTQQRISLEKNEYIAASPKSRSARIGWDCKTFFDYSITADQLSWIDIGANKTQAWILVQPLAFDCYLDKPLTFTQLRFFNGLDAKLTGKEVADRFEKKPFLFNTDPFTGKQKPLPYLRQSPDDSFQVRLGLRSPDGTKSYRSVELKANHFYLLVGQEYFEVPKDLCMQMRQVSSLQSRGEMHFAGFFDRLFKGISLIEHIPRYNTTLQSGVPICEFDCYRINPKSYPGDYGTTGLNHSVGQVGVRPAPCFNEVYLPSTVGLVAKVEAPVLDLNVRSNKISDFFEELSGHKY